MIRRFRLVAVAAAAAVALALAPTGSTPPAEAVARGSCSPLGWDLQAGASYERGGRVNMAATRDARFTINGRTFTPVGMGPEAAAFPGPINGHTVAYVTWPQSRARDVSCHFTLVLR